MKRQLMTQDAAGRPALNLSALFQAPEQHGALTRRQDAIARLSLPILAACGATPPRAALQLPTLARQQELELAPVPFPKTTTVAIPGVKGTLTNYGRNAAFRTLGDVQITLRSRAPRFINAATLKHLAGQPNAALLRQDDDVWRLCADSWEIDLAEDTKAYRLGDVTIYS